ncbi:MAG: hypothetical protein HYS38_01370 [Acidobacteria bacterium]|nr:hypothetical protein [Acidobacteriota bacterium]
MGKVNGRIEGRLVAVIMWLIPLAVVAVGARHWLPTLASEHGAGVDRMLHYLLVAVGSLLVVGHLFFGYFLWRFSGTPRATFRLPSPSSEKKLSLIPILAMALIAEGGVFVLGLPVWAKLYGAAPEQNAVSVEVTAEQFAWNVRYPGADGQFGRTSAQLLSLSNTLGLDREDSAARDDVILLNEIYLPVNRPARIQLRSKDVLHSFFLPHQRIKQDVVPGMTIGVWFVPTEVGTYELACAELCGFGHYQMRGLVHVVSEEEFNQWLREQPPYF